MRKKMFFTKVIQMAMSMFIFNISSICYGIYISSISGADTAGIFHLIMSVYAMGVSISVSGMSLTSTRLLSDMPSGKGALQADSITKKCMSITLSTSAFAAVMLFCTADVISETILSRPECAICFKMLAPTLLCIGISSVINGYFTAFAKVGATCIGKFGAEASGWIVLFCLSEYVQKDKMYIIITAACAISSITECVINFVIWRIYEHKKIKQKSSFTYRHILSVASPIALGSYLKTGLVSIENLLIPICLGYGGFEGALGKYGALKGMSVQILTFPYVFIGAFTSLIVPEIARRYSVGHKNSIKYISELSAKYISILAVLMWIIFFSMGSELCTMFFDNEDSGRYLKMLSFLPVFMYLDSVTDAILKGLNEQVFTLKVNIADSVMRTVLILLLVPTIGTEGYICIMYISEIINLTASYARLRKLTSLRFGFVKNLIMPLFASLCAQYATNAAEIENIIIRIFCFAGLYGLFIIVLSGIKNRKKQDLP